MKQKNGNMEKGDLQVWRLVINTAQRDATPSGGLISKLEVIVRRQNMKQYRKIILIITIIFGIILLTEISVGQFLPNLTFVDGNMAIVNRIIGYFSFSGFILSISILLKASKILTIPLGVILFTFFIINSYAEIYPIDTTTEPRDISVLQRYENDSKLVVREYKNAKTNVLIKDTVVVRDKFIFRQIIETTDSALGSSSSP